MRCIPYKMKVQSCSPSPSPVCVHNPHLEAQKDDILYHLSLGTSTHNLPAMFGDIRVMLMSFSKKKTKKHAFFFRKKIFTFFPLFSSLSASGAVPGEWRLSLSTLRLSSIWKTLNQSIPISVQELTAMRCIKSALCYLSAYVSQFCTIISPD